MSTDLRSPPPDYAAARRTNGAARTSASRQSLRQIREGIVVMWWGFFDWLAVVSWKRLLLVSLLVLILAGILKRPIPAVTFIVGSVIIKVVAGGKRRAELTADAAMKRAETEQLQRTVVEARLEALQAQIEPHFLFNTLASIDQLIQTDPPRASKMQQSLIRYLRSAMPQMREGRRPTLGQQVDLCSAFLEIMAVRMEGRLQAVVNVPEGLKSAVFPSMMLQTLVENAIKHGLEPKPEGGRIELGAEFVNGELAVHVSDTGVGFMPNAASGVGLANIRERLKALYGGRAELIIGVPPTGGTRATIKVPYETPLHQPDRDRLSARMAPSPAPTALIVDDERLMRDQIIGRLKEAWPELVIVGEAGNGREAIAMAQSLVPDIVFLDISMPGMDGIQAAEALVGKAHIVFVTAHDEYAISAFKHGAVDYLLKPPEPERVALTCERLRARLGQKPDAINALLAELSQRLGGAGLKPREYMRWVQASVGANIRMIPTSEILFFRAEDKYTRVQTQSFEALIRKPIKDLLDELDPNEFWQIHRAIVVRVEAVTQVGRNLRGNQVVHLKGSDEKLEVSRSFNHLFKQM